MIKQLTLLILLLCSIIHTTAQNAYTDSLKRLLSVAKDDSSKVLLLVNLSDQYVWTVADTGKMFAQQALQLSKKIDYPNGEGLSLISLCLGQMQTGNFTSSLDYGFKALTVFESLHDIANLIRTHIALMICYRDQGDYKQALVQGYLAKEMNERNPSNSTFSSLILSNISSVYEKSNQLDSALTYAKKVFTSNYTQNGLLITMGNIYVKKGNPALALDYYQKGFNFSTPYNRAIVDLYNGISKAFEKLNNLDSSVYYAQKSYLGAGTSNYPPGALEASNQLAHLYEIKSRYDSSLKYLKLSSILNDSLFSQQKTRDAQNFSFEKKMHEQDVEAQAVQAENKLRTYILLIAVFVFLLLAYIFWRNNRNKQKANLKLNKKNEQIESTLRELKSTQTQLIQSAKMASLGELTTGIAHEIQNPLNFVNNFSEVNNELIGEMKEELANGNLEKAGKIANEIQESLEKINHHGKRADAIVKGMLQHSRTSSGHKEAIDINALANEYFRLAYQGHRAKDPGFNVKLKTDFDPGIDKINVVPEDIGRVLLNLYNNALYELNQSRKNLPAGHDPSITISTKKSKKLVEIKISDNGKGIPENIIDKIFQPFFTTKPAGSGIGLGLSLAYDIATAHGGNLTVETNNQDLTTFTLKLPL